MMVVVVMSNRHQINIARLLNYPLEEKSIQQINSLKQPIMHRGGRPTSQ